MAQLGSVFDPNAVEPNAGFEDLPPGQYVAEIYDTKVKQTKSGTGQLVVIEWRVTEGELENRRIWQNINYLNSNDQAQKIGQGEFSKICRAIGFLDHVEDTDVIHGGQAVIIVKMGKGGNGYEPRAEVKDVKPIEASAATAAPAAQAPAAVATKPAAAPAAAAPKAAAAGGAPWRK